MYLHILLKLTDYTDCPADPAFAGSFTIDLTKGEPEDHIEALAGTQLTYDGSKGAIFSIKSVTDAPTVASDKYIFFGRIDVVMQAAPGAGIVTSVVLQSDDLDEIDIEFVGGDTSHVQTNYFSKGDTSTYDRGKWHPVVNPMQQEHTYSIDWTKDYVKWYVDGKEIRTLTYAEAKGGSIFPQTPMQVKFGTWVAGKQGASKGTIDWAGGITDFSKGPFVATYKSIKITDNMGGAKGAKEYVYGDKSGTWKSIKVNAENGAQAPVNDQPSPSAQVGKSSSVPTPDEEFKLSPTTPVDTPASPVETLPTTEILVNDGPTPTEDASAPENSAESSQAEPTLLVAPAGLSNSTVSRFVTAASAVPTGMSRPEPTGQTLGYPRPSPSAQVVYTDGAANLGLSAASAILAGGLLVVNFLLL